MQQATTSNMENRTIVRKNMGNRPCNKQSKMEHRSTPPTKNNRKWNIDHAKQHRTWKVEHPTSKNWTSTAPKTTSKMEQWNIDPPTKHRTWNTRPPKTSKMEHRPCIDNGKSNMQTWAKQPN